MTATTTEAGPELIAGLKGEPHGEGRVVPRVAHANHLNAEPDGNSVRRDGGEIPIHAS